MNYVKAKACFSAAMFLMKSWEDCKCKSKGNSTKFRRNLGVFRTRDNFGHRSRESLECWAGWARQRWVYNESREMSRKLSSALFRAVRVHQCEKSWRRSEIVDKILTYSDHWLSSVQLVVWDGRVGCFVHSIAVSWFVDIVVEFDKYQKHILVTFIW